MSTLTQLQTALRSRVGNPTTADVPDATLTDLINRSIEEIEDRYRFRNNRKNSSFTTVASQPSYNLPSDFLNVMAVGDTTNGVKLEQKDDQWFLSNRGQFYDSAGVAYEGKPLYYIPYRGYITLLPVPDASSYAIRVSYKNAYVPLATGTDEPLIPSVWTEGILKLARAKFYDDRQDSAKHQQYYNDWKTWVAEKPVEVDEDNFWDNQQGVIIPTLAPAQPRLDWFNATP